MFSRLWQGNNHKTFEIYRKKLRYIFLLHQTTTIRVFTKTAEMLCYIFLLHQTTTLLCPHNCRVCCVISFFYIKPQQPPMSARVECVVLYLSSTSNHNSAPVHIEKSKVVLYLSSTSNHNGQFIFSTSSKLCYIFLLHQTTTYLVTNSVRGMLCYIFLLHQTTTSTPKSAPPISCVISFFYIKPQPLLS